MEIKEWLVCKVKNLSDIVEIWVLNNKIPVRVIHPVVEIGDGDLHTPILPVIDLNMPVHLDRAHMFCALQQLISIAIHYQVWFRNG